MVALLRIQFSLIKYLILILAFSYLANAVNIDSLKSELNEAGDDILKVDILNSISFSQRRINFDTSYTYAKLAYDLADKQGYKSGKAYSLKNMGTVYWSKGNISKAKDFYYQSLRLYKEIADTNGMGRLWNNIGLIDITQEDFESSIQHFIKSIEFAEIVKDSSMIGTSYLNIGVAQYYLKNYAKAISQFRRSMDYAIAVNDSTTLANSFSFIGASFTKMEKYNQALDNLIKALDIYKKLNLVRDIAHSYNLLSDYYNSVSAPKKALSYAKLAFVTADSLNSNANLYEAYKNMSLAYSSMEKYKEAFENQSKANEIFLAISNDETKQKIAAMSVEYEYQNKIREIESKQQVERARQEANIGYRNMIIFAISIVALFLFVFAYFLYSSNKNKKIKNDLLTKQKQSINRQNKQLESMNHKLEDLNNTKDKFFSIIAHDLKNPVYSLNSMAQIVAEEYDTMQETEKREFVGHIHQSSKHLYSLLENLLTWSRSQRNQIEYQPVEADINSVLGVTIHGMRLATDRKNIQLNEKLGRETTVVTDVNLLNTIVRNILSNAIKFTPKGGKIEIGGSISGDYYMLSIKDSGVGMSSEKLETLFKTGDNKSTPGTENEKGTGIGLIISKEFALKNGGDISVKSTVGEGTTFTISVPLRNIST